MIFELLKLSYITSNLRRIAWFNYALLSRFTCFQCCCPFSIKVLTFKSSCLCINAMRPIKWDNIKSVVEQGENKVGSCRVCHINSKNNVSLMWWRQFHYKNHKELKRIRTKHRSKMLDLRKSKLNFGHSSARCHQETIKLTNNPSKQQQSVHTCVCAHKQLLTCTWSWTAVRNVDHKNTIWCTCSVFCTMRVATL